MNFLLNGLLNILDNFLSPEHRKSIDAAMRGRMAVFYLLFMIFLNAFIIVFASPSNVYAFEALPIFILVEILCLVLIKKSFSPEKIMGGFACLGAFSLVLPSSQLGSVDPTFFYNFLFAVMVAGLFVMNPKLNLVLQFLIFLAFVLCFLIVVKNFPESSWSTVSHGVDQMLFNTVISQVALLILIAMILKIRIIAQNDIDQEAEWQQRSMRLEELSTMTRTMQVLLAGPTQTLQVEFGSLKSGHDAASMSRIETELDKLVLISQSLSWIYRAFRQEASSSILSTLFLQQLSTLPSSKIKEEGWTLETRHPEKPFEIYGPLPSLMLLLFSMIVQILEEHAREERQLTVELDSSEKMVTWRLRWPMEGGSQKEKHFAEDRPASSTRQELIRELTQVCNAEIRESEGQDVHELTICGAWLLTPSETPARINP